MMRLILLILFITVCFSQKGHAQVKKNVSPKMTFSDVSYGSHERNLLDFWKADSDKKTPLVVFIHGGGFRTGDKKTALKREEDIERCLSQGVSYASINYPFTNTTRLDSILVNAARAIQFLRYKAEEWNIDKELIAVYGSSAGAGTSTWIGMHDDLKDPNSSDPVLRESSRVKAVGAIGVQGTYDVDKWTSILDVDKDWGERFGDIDLQLYHIKSRDEFYKPEIVKLRAFCDFPAFIDADDPPIYIKNNDTKTDILHHPSHAMYLKLKCDAAGVKSKLFITPRKVKVDISVVDFLLKELQKTKVSFGDVSYGSHERNVLDFWKADTYADSYKKTPLVVYIHGGGFHRGDKRAALVRWEKDIEKCLSQGVSYASINYPFSTTTRLDSILASCARAIQFLRYKSKEWNIDKNRIAIYGLSAGAGASTWIGMHNDLKDPNSPDPVLRESSRVKAVGALGVQGTYDFAKWANILDIEEDWAQEFKDIDMRLYHIKTRDEYDNPEVERLRSFLDFPELIDATDPPIFISNKDNEKDILHHPNHARYLKSKCDAEGLKSKLIINSKEEKLPFSVIEYLLEELLGK